MVELDDTNRNDFLFLGAQDGLLEDGVFQNLIANNGHEMILLGNIPPVVAVKGCVAVVAEGLPENTNKN